MFRYGSSSSVTSPRSPTPLASPSGQAAAPPTDPLPTVGTSPHSVLINRCNEVKRITKSLVNYFDGLATSHNNHGLALTKLAGPNIITTPLSEASLFLPAATTSTTKSNAEEVSPNGWGDLLKMMKDATSTTADEHQAFARNISKNVVVPLKKLRPDMKTHIANMDRELAKLADAVTRERDVSMFQLTALSNSLGPESHAETICGEDPVLLKAAVEAQLKQQVTKENEMLAAVIHWTERTEAKEKEVFREIARCWNLFEQANTTLLIGTQQRFMLLSGEVDAIPPEAEWNHFVKLNHSIPSDTQPREVKDIDFTGRDDPLTQPVREGTLERQKRFLKTWSPGFWVLSPSGHLHSYPSSSAPISHPSSSLALRHCTLGAMPVPEMTSKGKQLEAVFTIDAPDGKYVFRAKSWEELMSWWTEIEKFTKPSPAVADTVTTDSRNGGEEDDDAAAALAAERAQAEREMLEANQQRLEEEEARLRNGTAEGERGDLGASSPTSEQPTNGELGTAAPALPPRSPQVGASTAATSGVAGAGAEPRESDIGFSLSSADDAGDIGSGGGGGDGGGSSGHHESGSAGHSGDISLDTRPESPTPVGGSSEGHDASAAAVNAGGQDGRRDSDGGDGQGLQDVKL